MNFEDLDILYRSRVTLLKMLKEEGYATDKYERFGPWEIEAMVNGGQHSLAMELKRPGTGAEEEITNCIVLYSLGKLKQKIKTFVDQLLAEDREPRVDPKNTEVIVIVLEDVADVFHAEALRMWLAEKLKIRFFKAHNLIFDPREHIHVPKHEKLPTEQHADFLKANYIRSKSNLPIIKFHEDMIARVMGLVPGDIVKITRPSPASGTYEIYRVCMP
jgi:DNA-directed RNA polymerase subunit H (RpoH/RPB5)